MGGAEEKKDTVEKEFMSFPDTAADAINALLYQGDAVVDAESLLAGPTETVYQGRRKLRSQYEDLCKYELKNGRIRMMYLIANQSRTDGKMALRKAGYVGGVYREQYEGKIQDIFPAIEFVLYWGIPRWRSARSLKKLFRKGKLSQKEMIYIDESQLHIFEMRHLPEETRSLFRSDMRIVADFLAEGERYRSDRKIAHKAALIKMIKVLSGDTNTEDVEKWMTKQKIGEEDEITVCELFDQYVRQGEERGMQKGMQKGLQKGMQKGIQKGREEGMAETLVKNVEAVMKNFKVDLEKACRGLGVTVSRYEEAKKII